MKNYDKPVPFLRWAGGKTWLTKLWDKIVINNQFNNYIEPFLGGGAIFFSLEHTQQSILSDVNEELINTYKVVKENPEELLELLLSYQNNKKFYYNMRSKKPGTQIEKAAIFIYLNKTSYNGLYRVNKMGQYNVPYGNRAIKDYGEDKIRLASKALRNTELLQGDFANTLSYVNEGDLVFLDPPYTVSHNNNGFIKYNKKLFSLEDQYRLRNYIEKVREKGAYYILTNAAHETIREIFDFGDNVYKMSRHNLIGGTGASRGLISEYIFTNITKEV